MKLGHSTITRAYKTVERHGENKAVVSLDFYGILPRCRVEKQLSSGFIIGDKQYIGALFGHNGQDEITVTEFKNFVRSLPIKRKNFGLNPLSDKEFEAVRERAIEVDESIKIMFVNSPGYEFNILCEHCYRDIPHKIEEHRNKEELKC